MYNDLTHEINNSCIIDEKEIEGIFEEFKLKSSVYYLLLFNDDGFITHSSKLSEEIEFPPEVFAAISANIIDTAKNVVNMAFPLNSMEEITLIYSNIDINGKSKEIEVNIFSIEEDFNFVVISPLESNKGIINLEKSKLINRFSEYFEKK